ncbi:MAG: sigma-54-dependent transcriptional regulator [Anaerolineaceae bacterium]
MSITVLIVDDEENTRIDLEALVKGKGYSTLTAATYVEAREHVIKGDCDLILLDMQLKDGYGPNLLLEMATMPYHPLVIMITGYGDIDTAVEIMKSGAIDFLTKPVDFGRLEKSMKRASDLVSMKRELDHLREEQNQDVNFVVGKSERMKEIVELAWKAAQRKANVLITGETGTGKDVLAKYIHTVGTRRHKSFVGINCAAIQSTMLEIELFGYEPNSFTGAAQKRKTGLMEVADDGILFLNEISSMPLEIQAKLLTAIESQSFLRVAGTAPVQVDVQVISASNRNLPAMIESKEFREDLYYRLKVIEIDMPPLRERVEDIPELVGYFIRHYNMNMAMNVQEIDPRALEALQNHPWRGNIRELSNTIERSMIFCDGLKIGLSDLPLEVTRAAK